MVASFILLGYIECIMYHAVWAPIIYYILFFVCRCNDYVKASKRLTVKQAPNILTIALKRFQVWATIFSYVFLVLLNWTRKPPKVLSYYNLRTSFKKFCHLYVIVIHEIHSNGVGSITMNSICMIYVALDNPNCCYSEESDIHCYYTESGSSKTWAWVLFFSFYIR